MGKNKNKKRPGSRPDSSPATALPMPQEPKVVELQDKDEEKKHTETKKEIEKKNKSTNEQTEKKEIEEETEKKSKRTDEQREKKSKSTEKHTEGQTEKKETKKESKEEIEKKSLRTDEETEKKETKKDTDDSKKEPSQAETKKPTETSKKIDDERTPQGDCAVCGHLAKSFCSGCKHLFYCSRDHQRQDWNNHKEDCKTYAKIPYRVERNSDLGRFLVATKDFKSGELILNETPILVGPRQLTKPVCLGCHKELKGPKDIVACSRCTWPLCSRKCEESPYHEPECRILKYGGTKMNIENYGQVNMMYSCITVLRALALKQGPQKIWKEYTQFESHLHERMKTEIYNKINKEKVVFFIQHYLKLISKFSDLEILESCGRLDTNCFELRLDGLNLRALYRIGSIISHDCKPNTKHTFDPHDYSVNFYATVNIPKGSIISATYTQPLWCTYARREHLWMSKCFWCRCDRCKDPTEFGTDLSALICSKCGGRIYPTNPLDQDASWSCTTCGHSLSSKMIRDGNKSLTDELRKLDRTDSEVLEDFLKKYAAILPDTHQLAREVQYGIICLFKSVPPEMVDNKRLLRNCFLCKQLLEVAKKIDPGKSKWRGELLLQLQSASVVLAQRSLSEGRISNYQAQEIFEDNLRHLREAIDILQIEPEGKEDLQRQLQQLSTALEAVQEG